MVRPSAIGTEISVKSIDDADVALAELSWLENEQSRLDALAKQKIDAIKTEFQAKSTVTIDGQEFTIADRIKQIVGPLGKWVVKSIASHFKGNKKSVDTPHGTLGLRQQPRIVEIGAETSAARVLEAIDFEAGSVTAINANLVRKIPTFGGQVKDWLSIKVSLDLAAINAALEEKRITREMIESLGLVVRDACDLPVIKAAKMVVSAD